MPLEKARSAAYNAAYYAAHRDEQQAYYKLRTTLRRSYVDDLKAAPCMDCGGQFPPYVKQFDHRDPSVKTFTIAKGIHRSLAAIEAEAAKCDVVCANCHAVRTHKQRAHQVKQGVAHVS